VVSVYAYPRIPFIDCRLVAIKGAGTIVVYNQSFEKTRLQEIADFMPKHATSIDAALNHIWDLWPCVRKNVYHPAFGGSYSITVVLPALVPDMSYKGMAVAEGEAAGIAFMKMLDPSTPPMTGRVCVRRCSATVGRTLWQRSGFWS